MIVQRYISALSALINIIVALILVREVSEKGIQKLDIGSWPAPFGITLVSDMLSALLVLSTTIIGFVVILYSFKSIGKQREKFYSIQLFNFKSLE